MPRPGEDVKTAPRLPQFPHDSVMVRFESSVAETVKLMLVCSLTVCDPGTVREGGVTVTDIVTVPTFDIGGVPLSVAEKATLKVPSRWDWVGVNRNSPVDELKLIPATRPDAERVTTFEGTSGSVAVTVKFKVVPTATD